MEHFLNLEPVEFNPFAGPEIVRVVPTIEPQLEIWAACVLGGEEANKAYNESLSLLLYGTFNFSAFKSALQALVKRHEALRCVFNADGSNICIYKEVPFDFIFEDLSQQKPGDQEKYLADFSKRDAESSFDLLNGPLLRTALFKINEKQHCFIFTAHHIICDGWSLGIIMQDLSKLYSAYARNEMPSLAPAYQFSQYAIDQLEFAKSEEYKKNEEYWIHQYKDNIPFFDLPIDFPRPLLRTYKSKRQDFPIEQNLISEIKKTGVKAGCSFVSALMAAFEIFLYRLTNQNEIVLGVPASGQSASGNYSLVGHCVNLLPVRSRPDGNTSFIEYLKRRKTKIFNDYDHQQFTFGSLLNKLNIVRDASRIPLVPVAFNIDIGLDDGVVFHGLTHKLISNPRSYESFEIFLNITGSNESFVLEWSYNTQLFSDSTITHMMEEFEFLLQCIAREPELEIRDIPTLLKSSLAPELSVLNYPKDKTIVDLFSEQASETPDRPAILFGNKKITYRELNERANQLGHYLKKKGVGPETLVPICIERSIEMLVSILGVLKAGGAYLPIDPEYPEERIEYMLHDSNSNIIVTSRLCFNRLPKKKGRNIVLLEDQWVLISKESVHDPVNSINPNSLAYVIYTSGSTGKPKGAMIEHGNVVSLVCGVEYVTLTSRDVLLSTGSPSFDATTFEYWGMLLNGGQLILCEEQTLLNSTLLKEAITKNRVNIMWVTSSLFNQWVNLDISVFESLKTILVGGEKLSEKHISKLRKTYPSIVIINGYGPTENTTFSLTYKITEKEITNSIPIGKALSNRTAYVLDQQNQICAVGVVGELYVGGAGLGRGYLNRSDLTNERFVNDPFTITPSKMYKTGDLVRRLADGNIEYIGRIDDQVKIRGYRIEIGEIESVLQQCPYVKHSVVIVNEDNNGDKRLVGYIVPEDKFNKEAISLYLHSKLPDYMIPKILIRLDKIPLTNNGKADRKALPRPEQIIGSDESSYVAPQTEFQKVVAEIWAEVLGLKKVSITADFFELGGHSLLALKAMLATEKKTGKRLPLSLLLENSTIERLSDIIEANAKEIKWDCFVPIKVTGSKVPVYFIHGAGLNILTFRSISKHLDADQPVYGLQAKGLNGKDESLNKMEDIAKHYISEIVKHNPFGPYALAGYSFGGLVAYEMAKQLKEMGKKVIMVGLFDTYAEQSDYYDPLSKKIPARIKTFFKKVWCTLVLMTDDPWYILNFRINSFRKWAVSIFKRINIFKRKKDPSDFYVYSEKIIKDLLIAARDYKLTPYDGTVDLFRAGRKTYYLPDFEYLGWKPFALKGVNVYDVPGNHSEIFNHPNVEILAKVLQSCLDDAMETKSKIVKMNSF